jgi:broad specificity phosphatase PhoE
MGAIFNLFFPSKKKLIYFVRHGETVLNAARIRQGSEGPLSDRGRQQAEVTGDRLKMFRFEAVLVSPFQRTKETAEIINKYLNKKLEFVDLLVERRNPKEIIGKSTDDPDVKRVVDLIDKSFHEGNLRISDEENFEDLKARANALLEYLSKRPEKSILCVTHGIFLTMVVAVIQYGDKLTASDFARLYFHNQANNAGITVCEYDPRQKKHDTKGWALIAWNDYSRQIKSAGVPT